MSRINTVCVNAMRNNIYFKYSSNKTVNSFLKKKFSFECFHRYDKFFLLSYVLCLKMSMLFMLFRNLDFFVQCNNTQVRLTRIFEHVLKTKIISNKSKDQFILIPRISLLFKNDKNNKNRKNVVLCQFEKMQYLVRFVFVITINKS